MQSELCGAGESEMELMELCGVESEMVETKPEGVMMSPAAYRAFEDLLMGWLDRYQDELDCGGFGNPKELATLVAAWAKAYLHTAP